MSWCREKSEERIEHGSGNVTPQTFNLSFLFFGMNASNPWRKICLSLVNFLRTTLVRGKAEPRNDDVDKDAAECWKLDGKMRSGAGPSIPNSAAIVRLMCALYLSS